MDCMARMRNDERGFRLGADAGRHRLRAESAPPGPHIVISWEGASGLTPTFVSVISGRGLLPASPESITIGRWLWIPGSRKSAPRNDPIGIKRYCHSANPRLCSNVPAFGLT